MEPNENDASASEPTPPPHQPPARRVTRSQSNPKSPVATGQVSTETKQSQAQQKKSTNGEQNSQDDSVPLGSLNAGRKKREPRKRAPRAVQRKVQKDDNVQDVDEEEEDEDFASKDLDPSMEDKESDDSEYFEVKKASVRKSTVSKPAKPQKRGKSRQAVQSEPTILSTSSSDVESVNFVGSDDSDNEVIEVIDIKTRAKGKKGGKRATKKAKIVEEPSERMKEEQDMASKMDFYQWPIQAEREIPSQLVINLLPFQRESLKWMQQQEEAPAYNGGILADEMGMGKTLQMISLILKNRHHFDPSDPLKTTTTLIIMPVVALTQWEFEISKYTKENTFSVLVYHGTERESITKEQLLSVDIVLTTYSVVEADFRYQYTGRRRKDGVFKKDSLIHGLKFYRIVLDEAHSIKDRTCSTARAVFGLQSCKKWCMTGTPLQNRIGELYSLIRFLRITPFSYYYCKKCDCKSLNWIFEGKGARLSRICRTCPHKPTNHFSWWNKHIINPIYRSGTMVDDGEGEKAMDMLKKLLSRIMLRRTKMQRATDLCLPPKVITIRRDNLDAEENDFYEALYTRSKTQFMGFIQSNTILDNYAHVFDLLLRLRQAVDHPYLVLHRETLGETTISNEICGICSDPAEDCATSKCKHSFCRECIQGYLANSIATSSDAPPCPVCKSSLTIDLRPPEEQKEKKTQAQTRKSIMERLDLSNWRTSTKIEALIEELTIARQRDPTAKSLVFSQFVNFLDIIEWKLKMAGFGCVRLDGRMNIQQRSANIEKFKHDPETCVFLISLKAGGVALNLTVASHCFLMDPWWNPACENQAIDRVHRLGQRKPISVTRLIIQNTIEERIMSLQEKKGLLFQTTIGMDKDAAAKLTVDDLRFLFVN